MRKEAWRQRVIIQCDCFLVLSTGFVDETFHFQGLTQVPVSVIKSRIHLDRFAQLLDRGVVAPRTAQDASEIGINDHR